MGAAAGSIASTLPNGSTDTFLGPNDLSESSGVAIAGINTTITGELGPSGRAWAADLVSLRDLSNRITSYNVCYTKLLRCDSNVGGGPKNSKSY